eukprot:CCRYP_002034-RA/>CCRYP_002034-RA protein AED:0.26 eAED:0.26 QI:348/1/1/1/1/1/2/131/940
MARFTDFGDPGTYTGDVDQNGKRHGRGKMVYDSGNTYEGGFVNDKFEGDGGIYTWSDGDEQESQWKQGKRNGKSIFRAANGEVEYSLYQNDEAVGTGVTWSPDRTIAHKLVDGKKKDEISLGMAEKIAKDTFGWDVPEPSSGKNVVRKKMQKGGLFARMFSKSYVDAEGNLRFKDHGTWGTYVGDLDSDGKRNGKGKITYDDGGYYDGHFVDDKFHKTGVYKWNDGDEYDGEWADGERNGIGIFRKADGGVEYSFFKNGSPVGDGVSWNADRTTAHNLKDGETKMEMLPEEAKKFALEKFNLPVPAVAEVAASPPPAAAATPPAPSAEKSVGLFQRLFSTGPRFDEDGKPMFKDHGDWGSWSGEVDDDNKRKGKGTITYKSGNEYTGGFVDDKYEDDSGDAKYTWYDGEQYVGQWKNGERHGKGIFKASDGSVEYSMYENGVAVGQGLRWTADRQIAYRLVDGEKKTEISLGVAEKEAKEKFDLSVPEVSATPLPSAKPASKAVQPGLFQRLFKGVPPIDEDGNPMFKDNGDWGSYVGERDAEGKRHGRGKMTYKSGSMYEGGFVNNKYEDDESAKYTWPDGDEYVGQWKDGERHGKGTFYANDGTVEISMFENGITKGEGISWSADRKTAHKLVDGVKKIEMLPEEAKAFALEKFNVDVPEVSKAPPKKAAPSSGETKQQPGIFQRLWNKYDADGNLMYKDNGDWGSWKGELDSQGKRTGKGTMTYDGGAVYEGDFVDDVYEGYGKYTWEDMDEYEGEWKAGERNGKGIFRGGDGVVEYSMYENGKPIGDGISWAPDRKTAFRMKDGIRALELLVAEAESISKEKFDLPIPEYYAPKKASGSSGSGFFGWFTSNKAVGPTEEKNVQSEISNSQSIVEKWLQTELPNLNSDDLKTYSKQLLDDGFDSTEMLDHLVADDLGFMKKAHRRVLVEKLEKKNKA